MSDRRHSLPSASPPCLCDQALASALTPVCLVAVSEPSPVSTLLGLSCCPRCVSGLVSVSGACSLRDWPRPPCGQFPLQVPGALPGSWMVFPKPPVGSGGRVRVCFLVALFPWCICTPGGGVGWPPVGAGRAERLPPGAGVEGGERG